MRHTFGVEIREAVPGRRRLHGVMVTEGRAATGGRRELFAPGSVSWPSEGVGISIGHHNQVETRAHAIRDRAGQIEVSGDATAAIVDRDRARAEPAQCGIPESRGTRHGGRVREILSAFVPRAALTDDPEYDTTAAEVRAKARRPAVWL